MGFSTIIGNTGKLDNGSSEQMYGLQMHYNYRGKCMVKCWLTNYCFTAFITLNINLFLKINSDS